MALAPGTRIGPYDVAALIGAGGMGEVYRATDTNLGRPVVIKVLPLAMSQDAERISRFNREAKTLASLSHPNIAIIHGLEKSGGMTALVMELVEGGTLAERLLHGRLPVAEAADIARQIASAIEAAHEKGIVHRDLKPANVMVTPEGLVKVLDFGLARPALGVPGDASASPTVSVNATREGAILGTVQYMSPEQARGRPVDRRTDIWAFGCVLFEMLSGRPPFAAETVVDTLAAIVEREPDWSLLPADTPDTLRRLLRRSLDKNPHATLT